MSALVIWHILRVQGKRFRPMNGFRIEAADNFGLENLLRPSQDRRCHGLDPDRFVVRLDIKKRRFPMFYCVSQRHSSVFAINMSNYIFVPVCVCVCVCKIKSIILNRETHTIKKTIKQY